MVTVFSMVPPIQLHPLFQTCYHLEFSFWVMIHLEFVAHGAIPCSSSQSVWSAYAGQNITPSHGDWREHMTRQQGLWKPTTTLTPALNADSIPRKKFFVFLVASAIEASSRRKTVSFTGPKRWQHSTKKVLRFPRRQCDWSEFTVQNGVFHIQHSLRVW